MANVLLNGAPHNGKSRSMTWRFKFLDDEIAREAHDKSDVSGLFFVLSKKSLNNFIVS